MAMACRGCAALSLEIDALRKEVSRLAVLSAGVGGKPSPAAFTAQERSKTSIASRVTNSVSPSAPRDNDWRVVASSATRLRILRGPDPLPLSNKFASLEEVEEGVSDGSVLVVGDSMVRGQSIILRRKTGRQTEGLCIGGGGVKDISTALKSSVLCPRKTTVVAVGTNDIGTLTSEALRGGYRELLQTLRERRCPSVVFGILPRMSAGAVWSSRAIAVNSWLSSHCSLLGIPFVDLWGVFVRSPHFYRHDGVHLSVSGKEYICEVLNELLLETSVFRGFLG